MPLIAIKKHAKKKQADKLKTEKETNVAKQNTQ